VGDFDSVSPSGLARVEAAGAVVERHPAAKDQTDLDLALRVAVGLGAGRIVVVGGGGGRLDHLLANALLLTAERFAAATIEARFGRDRLHVVRRDVTLAGRPGDLVTLLAIGRPATGVTTAGLRYPLDDATLDPASSLGVSNELVGDTATVTVGAGVLLAVQPGGTD
jgi:thiamine pyrophosphokinase